MGDTAEQVLREFHSVIGKPYLPPLWALGFHQGSTSYNTSDTALESVKKYKEVGIPLEALFLDESYMDGYLPFNVDKNNFKMSKLVKELKKNNQKVAMSMHACIPVYDTKGNIYSYFTEGKDTFIKSASKTSKVGGDILIGEFLPGKCAYVDYHNSKSYNFLSRGLGNLWGDFNFDGIQFNYNEITQFCDGECPEEDKEKSVEEKFSDLPFNPLGKSNGYKLHSQTISLDAKFTPPEESQTDSHVSFNNQGIYGTQMMIYANLYLQHGSTSPLHGKRALIMSRSTFSGAGQYGGHWLGDNTNTFEDMKLSISGILNFNLFGMPLTGANVCGTEGSDNEEVCARWYQLASAYPYARSYFNGSFGTKEAWALTGKYQEAAKNALTLRLSLLRYYYTIFFEINQKGGSFWRPLFFEFPDDNGALDGIYHF